MPEIKLQIPEYILLVKLFRLVRAKSKGRSTLPSGMPPDISALTLTELICYCCFVKTALCISALLLPSVLRPSFSLEKALVLLPVNRESAFYFASLRGFFELFFTGILRLVTHANFMLCFLKIQ